MHLGEAYLKKFLRLICAPLAFCASLACATTYSYVGPTYVTATGLYTTSMHVTGSFTTASPLPKNMALTDIGPDGGSNLVTSWSFSDGVNTYTNTNTVLLYGIDTNFAVSTDAGGNVLSFNLGFMAPVPPNTVDEPMNAIFLSPGETQATTAALCSAITAGVCTFIPTGSANFATADTPGVWQLAAVATVTPVPTLSESALVLLGIGVAMLAVLVRRRRVA
jgi:hypothetical protein